MLRQEPKERRTHSLTILLQEGENKSPLPRTEKVKACPEHAEGIMVKVPIAPRWAALLAIALLTVIVVGCYNKDTGETNIGGAVNFTLPAFPETGANAVQVFTEMHYQPSYRAQEDPRLLPPDGSVPVTGGELRYATLEEYKEIAVPGPASQSYNDAKTHELYSINCSVCHGNSLKGDGRITQMKHADGTPVINKGPFPANLKLPVTSGSTDGELFGFITNGGRQGLAATERGRESASPMPSFGSLLTENERWAIVQYLRARIGGP